MPDPDPAPAASPVRLEDSGDRGPPGASRIGAPPLIPAGI